MNGAERKPRADAKKDRQPQFVSGEILPPRWNEVRRHVYECDGAPVKVKVKQSQGLPWISWYRVEGGWQDKKPDGFMYVPYFKKGFNPFDNDSEGFLYWPEGEKDTDTVAGLGLRAFTFGGTGDGLSAGAKERIAPILSGEDVVILADNDVPGEEHARAKAAFAHRHDARSVRIIKVDGAKDVSDWVAASKKATPEVLAAFIEDKVEDTPLFVPDQFEQGSEGLREPSEQAPIKFKLTSLDDLKSSTTSEYLVKGWFPRRGLVEVWGPPKCGKSFWVFTVMLHVAMGREYRGCRVHQSEVVYLPLEGQAGFANRRDAFYKEFLEPGDKVTAFKLCGATLDLIKDHQQLISDIKEQATNPGCIVIDTLNRSLNGSENKDVDMGAYIRAADTLQKVFDCLVVIIHHCGIDESRPRGHSSQTGAVDVQISVKKDAAGIVTSTVELAKDMAEGATLASRLEVVELGLDQDGDPITSCVCNLAPDTPKSQGKAQAKLNDNQRRFLDILRTATIDAPDDCKDTTLVPNGVRAVTRDILKKYLSVRGWLEEGESNNARAKVSNMINALAGKRVIGATNRHVWEVR
jgi:hypothetical protein